MKRKLLILIAASSLTAGCEPRKNEIAHCNDPRVVTAIQRNTLDPWLDFYVRHITAVRENNERRRQLNSGAEVKLTITDPPERDVSNWTLKLGEAREIKYDSRNNTRLCEANVASPPELREAVTEVDERERSALGPVGMFLKPNDPRVKELKQSLGITEQPRLCRREIRYLIQPLLDQPNNFYLSWECEGFLD